MSKLHIYKVSCRGRFDETEAAKGGIIGRQLRIEYPNAYYHVTARGNEQKDIFKNDRDRQKFLERENKWSPLKRKKVG